LTVRPPFWPPGSFHSPIALTFDDFAISWTLRVLHLFDAALGESHTNAGREGARGDAHGGARGDAHCDSIAIAISVIDPL
jgi:hypothetical protein